MSAAASCPSRAASTASLPERTPWQNAASIALPDRDVDDLGRHRRESRGAIAVHQARPLGAAAHPYELNTACHQVHAVAEHLELVEVGGDREQRPGPVEQVGQRRRLRDADRVDHDRYPGRVGQVHPAVRASRGGGCRRARRQTRTGRSPHRSTHIMHGERLGGHHVRDRDRELADGRAPPRRCRSSRGPCGPAARRRPPRRWPRAARRPRLPPTAATRTVGVPSRARFSATFRPTPPGDRTTWPGLLVPVTTGRALRALTSMFAPPITTAVT